MRFWLRELAGWLLVELVYSFYATPKRGERTEGQQRAPSSSAKPIQ